MKKGAVLCLSILLVSVTLFSGCKNVQIFEKKEKLEYTEVSESKLEPDVYYVKTGTKFAKVYLPDTTTFEGESSKIDQSRVVYFTKDDEFMIPQHYEGELVAYASPKAELKRVVLERFEDMGYSFGIVGGQVMDDGYYHFSVKDNTLEGTEARKLFSTVESDDIRIVSVGGSPMDEITDPGSGIITQLKQGGVYTVEFYAGTYYYRSNFTADTHMMRPFELYSYDEKYLSDTTHGYMCFNTPSELLSGYYLINGGGLFCYHAYTKGKKVENEDYNVGFYANKEEAEMAYKQQYNVNVPQNTKDMCVTAYYGDITDSFDVGEKIEATIIAPDGTEYQMENDELEKSLSMTVKIAQAGSWTMNIYPKSLEIKDISVAGDPNYEETAVFEQEYTIDKDETFQMFYADVTGDTNEEVRGSVIDENGVTYKFTEGSYQDSYGKYNRYIAAFIPYMKAGKYTVKIYYYKSKNVIKNLQLTKYDDTSSEVFIIEDNGKYHNAKEEIK